MSTANQSPVKRIDQDPLREVDKIQPNAIEVEELILGGLLMFGGTSAPIMDEVLSKLSAEHFYNTRHAKVYRVIQKLHSQDTPVDMTTVLVEMTKGNPSQMGEIQSFLIAIVDRVVSPTMIDAYADIVIEKAYRRDVIKQAVELLDIATDETIDPAGVRNHIEQNLLSLLTQKSSGGRFLADSMPDAFARLQEAAETGVMPGIPTGFDELNDLLQGGFRRKTLTIVAGRPSMGKSAFAISNLLPYIASVTGQTSLIFSLEMSEEELIHRYWASRMTNPYAINSLSLKDKDWQQLGAIVSELSDLNIYVDETPQTSFDYIRSESRKMKAKYGALGCIVIDYLQIMDYGGIGGNQVQAIGKITSGLKALAKELDTPIILLSQLSRGVESRDNKRPLMSDLRDSGTIEQDADVIIMLYRDEYYKKGESEEPGVAEIIIQKQRGGATGTVKLGFDGPRSTFSSLDGPVKKYSYPDEEHLPARSEEVAQPRQDYKGVKVGDSVVCEIPAWYDGQMRREAEKESHFGQSGTVAGFEEHPDLFGDMEVVARVNCSDGKSRLLPLSLLKVLTAAFDPDDF